VDLPVATLKQAATIGGVDSATTTSGRSTVKRAASAPPRKLA
jgi:hypothetical protein